MAAFWLVMVISYQQNLSHRYIKRMLVPCQTQIALSIFIYDSLTSAPTTVKIVPGNH